MDHQQIIQSLAVERYLLSEMDPDERDLFEQHYFECSECAEDVRSAVRFLDDAKREWVKDRRFGSQGSKVIETTPKDSAWSWLAWLQPQFAAPALAILTVAAGVGMISNVGLRKSLEEATAPSVVTTTILRPETRGEPTVVVAQPDATVVLEFDLLAPHSAPLQFVIKSANDQVVFRLTDRTTPKEHVILSIPRFELPPGRYTLELQPGSSTGERSEQYPLEVRRP